MEVMVEPIQWIFSAGGPLILIPESLLSKWRGALVSDEPLSDYKLACSIDGYIGTISWAGHHLLILNDEPLQTALLYTNQGLCFARWIYALSEEAAESALSTMHPEQWSQPLEAVELQVREASHILMDAGAPGSSVDLQQTLRINIEPGTYSVRVHNATPREDMGFLIIVLQRT